MPDKDRIQAIYLRVDLRYPDPLIPEDAPAIQSRQTEDHRLFSMRRSTTSPLRTVKTSLLEDI